VSDVDFWQRAAVFAFGAWAIAVPIGVRLMLRAADRVAAKLDALAQQFQRYALDMEARVRTIEVNQQHVMAFIDVLKKERL
jgi:hypothetical protein